MENNDFTTHYLGIEGNFTYRYLGKLIYSGRLANRQFAWAHMVVCQHRYQETSTVSHLDCVYEEARL